MSKGTARRSIRVGDLWEKAQQVADQRGDNLSDIIRQALEKYVQDNQEGTTMTQQVSIPAEEIAEEWGVEYDNEDIYILDEETARQMANDGLKLVYKVAGDWYRAAL